MLTQIFSKVWMVSPKVPRYPYGNCLYIEDSVPTIIDLGAGATAFADVPQSAVQRVLISHSHFDHLHCTSLFPDAGLYAAEEERLTYSDEQEYLKFHGWNLWDELMSRPREPYGQVVKLPDDVPVQPGFRLIKLQDTFTDLTRFDTGSMKVTAMHLPGHTRGHYGFYFEHENVLFSGDIDLVATRPWYNNDSGNVGDLIRSVRRVKDLAPRMIISSHRRTVLTEDLPDLLDAYIQVVLDRESRIYELLVQPQSLDDLAGHRLTFPGQQNIYELFWEKMTMRQHIIHLMELGLINEIESGLYIRK